MAAAVLALASAAGAGSKPHLLKVEPDRTFGGSVVEVTGTNFTGAIEQISATLGSEPAFVLEARSDWLKLIVPPGLAPGSYALEVRVAGEASANRLQVTIRPEREREEKSRRDAEEFEGDGARQAALKVLALFRPEPVSDRGSLVVQVSGEAALPDGCNIVVEIKLEGTAITTLTLPVQSRRFAGAFGPYTRDLFADDYWVEASFLLASQPPRVKKAIRDLYARSPLDLGARERATDRQPVRIGAPGQKERELEELRGHIARCLERVRELLHDLEMQYSGAARSWPGFRKDGKLAEAAWEDWLATRWIVLRTIRNELRGLSRDARRARAREAAPRVAPEVREAARFLTDDGRFADARWREWIDHKLRADIRELAKGHVAYRDRFLVVKHADAMDKLDELFAMLKALSEQRSRELYEGNGLPVAGQDAERDPSADLLRFDAGSELTASDIETAARKIAREVNLPAKAGHADERR